MSYEIPLGKRSLKYRFFEILPGFLSYGFLISILILSYFRPYLASIILLMAVFTLLVKAAGIASQTIRGYFRMIQAQNVDWRDMLDDLRTPKKSLEKISRDSSNIFGRKQHINNLTEIVAHPDDFPKVEDVRHVVIVTAYNESYEVISPTMQSLVDTTIDKNNLIIAMAYEERGGEDIEKTVNRLEEKYGHNFADFLKIKHPKNLKDEVIGKGANITYAGKKIAEIIKDKGGDFSNYIITTLDCDNRPHHSYFDYVSYEYIVHKERKHLSYQPIALFVNNIWDVPAPMRILATGNSFWNVISSMRPDRLRNFASHSQSLDALYEMDFWSKRTIVEDGHQYWRSYFHFRGDYSVVPVHVPIYQDAVLSDTFRKTLVAQFKQLRRWSYGVSDIPYVASNIFTKKRKVPLVDSFLKFGELVDGHLTQATMPILVAVGGWLPLLISPDSARSVPAHQLPVVVSYLMQISMIGLFISIYLSFKLLPPRPNRYKRSKNVFMLLQWILMPITSVAYNALACLNAQTHLMLGAYLDKFDVTDKATVGEIDKTKESKKKEKSKK